MAGFHFTETMSGHYRLSGGDGERPISFTATARAVSWLQHLVDHRVTLEGTFTAEGFATKAALTGEMEINPLLGRFIRYEFGFTADDGQRYRFSGKKDIAFTEPVASLTTLPATIVDGQGHTVATADLKFDPSDLPRFLGSFRPTR